MLCPSGPRPKCTWWGYVAESVLNSTGWGEMADSNDIEHRRRTRNLS
jgi:hypothetical protein